jgi:A/G-specific adenine glycosylase
MRDDPVKCDASARLLEWYDAHARELPWRVSPERRMAGVLPDPYAVWLSEVMLQQTTVAAVRSYFEKFLRKWPRCHDLAAADDADVMAAWAGLGYYARARNLLKCAREVTARGGFPTDLDGLRTLPGIGPYTAAAIASIAYDLPETVVDGNVERVIARLFRVETPLPAAKPEITELAAQLTPNARPGDYAQAVMDLGATVCTPRNPSCDICPLTVLCAANQAGVQADLPRKTPKPAKPTRYGVAYVVRRSDGAWLLERRPEKGLLGGMLGWPGADWGAAPIAAPPLMAEWTEVATEVRHTFTHFHLRLQVMIAHVGDNASPTLGNFHSAETFAPQSLPTVMRKVFDQAVPHFPTS